MTALNRSTCRRLNQLTQIPCVWEGDRRQLSANGESDAKGKNEYIVWVDGTQGVVRAVDVVAPEAGPEAVVRTLLRAIESPQGPVKPARPQKIVVRDREIQFFLRGVLQDLGITIEYVPSLPLIDELFREFEEDLNIDVPELPPQYAEKLIEAAIETWQNAPWQFLEEHNILSVKLNLWDIGNIYVSVMGMLGKEYGILFYRSLESLQRFRASILRQQEDSIAQMEEAFLKQDCLFVTFESTDDLFDEYEDEDIDLSTLSLGEIQPNFGNIHPLEGLRSSLFEEEALTVLVTLSALNRFLRQHRRRFLQEDFPSITSRYRIPLPQNSETTDPVSIEVATLPEVSKELLQMEDEDNEDDEDGLGKAAPILRDDLIPEEHFLSIEMLSWDVVDHLRSNLGHFQAEAEVQALGDGLPVILLQISRPKANQLIEKIEAAGGLKAIFFNPGEDPFEEEHYDIGIIQTNNGEIHLFGEFMQDDPVYIQDRKKWEQRSKKTKGYCGLLIARGLKGASRGNPKLPDMMALFEARSLSHKDLGLGTLQRMFQLDFE